MLKAHQLDRASGGPLVLVVDDDMDIREALAEVLEDAGYQVAAAANGAEAWQYLHTHPAPDLILLDLLMPVMTGPELLDQIRTSDELSRIPTVIMTASPQWNPSSNLRLLTKPMRTEQLLTIIRQLAPPADEGT